VDAVLGLQHPEQVQATVSSEKPGPATAPDAEELAVDRVTRRFSTTAGVSEVSFTVSPGELLALVGASGSGKTTTLRIIAGYEVPDSGRVLLGGTDITNLPPQRRGFGMVFQHYALFPHMSVEENVAFGLEARGVARGERVERARRALASVGLDGAGKRTVQSLSGGEQQRVAMARALIIEPRALLLDEPLSNLDPTLRQQMRGELSAMLHRASVPAVLVTHDQEDAFAIADRIVLLRAGKVLQIGAPEDIYRNPASLEVARFIGRGTVLPVVREDDATFVWTGNARRPIDAMIVPHEGKGQLYALLRPESLDLGDENSVDAWRGVVRARRFAGSVFLVTVELDDGTLVDIESDKAPPVGDQVSVRPKGAPIPLFYE
jgi:ABC-type Fe3+/spermidine/putrescine transport system ATPase subunit